MSQCRRKEIFSGMCLHKCLRKFPFSYRAIARERETEGLECQCDNWEAIARERETEGLECHCDEAEAIARERETRGLECHCDNCQAIARERGILI